MSTANFLSTGNAYDALQFEELDHRARNNTRALGQTLWNRGFMRDALNRFGTPATEYIGEEAARILDLDREALAALTTEEKLAEVSARLHHMHLRNEIRLFEESQAA